MLIIVKCTRGPICDYSILVTHTNTKHARWSVTILVMHHCVIVIVIALYVAKPQLALCDILSEVCKRRFPNPVVCLLSTTVGTLLSEHHSRSCANDKSSQTRETICKRSLQTETFNINRQKCARRIQIAVVYLHCFYTMTQKL